MTNANCEDDAMAKRRRESARHSSLLRMAGRQAAGADAGGCGALDAHPYRPHMFVPSAMTTH